MYQKALVLTFLAALLVALAPTGVDGQCACYAADPQGPYFDVNTVETLTGQITSVERVEALRKGWGDGIHLEMDVGGEALMAHLGPAWFMDNQAEEFEKGDEVEVTGSIVTVDGARQIIAATVRRGDTVLHLRNEEGYPNWQAWRRTDGQHRCGLGPPGS